MFIKLLKKGNRMVYPTFYKEKRKKERIISRCPLRYNLKGHSDFSDTITRDISEHGLRFITNEFVPASSELFLEFSWRQCMEPVRATARVAWIQKVPHSDQYHIGAQFTEVHSNSQKDIFKHLTERKKYPFAQAPA